jgi:hypothetical protein
VLRSTTCEPPVLAPANATAPGAALRAIVALRISPVTPLEIAIPPARPESAVFSASVTFVIWSVVPLGPTKMPPAELAWFPATVVSFMSIWTPCRYRPPAMLGD